MCEHEGKFTKCDKCARIEERKENRKVIKVNVKYGGGEVSHYVLNIGEICEKEAEKDSDIEELLAEIKKLNGRHQSDCITINQLQTTIDVLVDKLARLREAKGL